MNLSIKNGSDYISNFTSSTSNLNTTIQHANNLIEISNQDLLNEEISSLFKKNVSQQTFTINEKHPGYILGELVVRPLIDLGKACINHIFTTFTSIDQSLSFPIVAAQEDEVTSEHIKDIQQIIFGNWREPSCLSTSTYLVNSVSLSRSRTTPPNNIHDLMNEARNAHIEFQVAKYFKQKGKHSLINKLFKPEEIDIINNGPVIWKNIPMNEVGHWNQGVPTFCRRVHRWAREHGYVTAFPTFEESPGVVGIYLFKSGTVVWKDLYKKEIGHWSLGEAKFFRLIHRWGLDHGFIGGIPTFEESVEYVGASLFKKGIVQWRDLPMNEVGHWNQGAAIFSRRVHRFARAQGGYESAIPTFEESGGVVGAHLIPKSL